MHSMDALKSTERNRDTSFRKAKQTIRHFRDTNPGTTR